ncbi:MAG: DEAD/DEAH box helicase [Burkholderiales bacterium]
MTQSLESPVAPAGDRFASLGLHESLVRAVEDSGYTTPTPVQRETIPLALEGLDLMVSSATGSGKTAAFMLPILHRLAHAQTRAAHGAGPRMLILTPTRELSMQVTKACDVYGRSLKFLTTASVVGGVPYGAQLRALRGRLDVLVATPGRLLDLLNSGRVTLSRVEVLVLDEADRMLDMGFIEDIEAIAAATPSERQTLLFSATLGGRIAQLGAKLLRDPRRIEIQAPAGQEALIEQRLHWADGFTHKNKLLDRLLADPSITQAVVFTSTQRDAERVAETLQAEGHAASALHGGMPQGVRNRTLHALRQRRLRILVATDVAARGIDVPTITHVINYGLPINVEDYVHRIGRTGRAGRSGLAVTLAEQADVPKIRRIERFTNSRIPVATLEGLEPRFVPGRAPSADRGRRPSGGKPGYAGKPGFRRGEGSTNRTYDSAAPRRRVGSA